jgi:glycosyltransferase involved in cell wall biosynthesis
MSQELPGSARRRRIAVLLENCTYPQDTRVRNEAESLAAAGHSVVVIAPRGEGQRARERVGAVEVRRFAIVWASGSKLSYLLEYGIAHVQLIARAMLALAAGADTLHLNGPPDTLALAGALARVLGRSVVYDMHDSGPELFETKFGSARATWALRAAQRAAIGCAHEVIVTNETQREIVLDRGRATARQVTVVRNGPRAREFPAPPPARPGSLRAPRLIYVGALDLQDGVLDLAETMADPALAAAQLTIVGEGAARAELTRRCRAAGLQERVRFTGRVPHTEVAGLIAEADIAIDPAPGTPLNHGSTMIKIAEYMACGRPLVAYELHETRRTAAGAALYAPCGRLDLFAALIARLAHDGDLRRRLADLGRERASELTWQRSERALCEVYERLASTASR